MYDPVTNVTWSANANLAATASFGLPTCTTPGRPKLCVGQHELFPQEDRSSSRLREVWRRNGYKPNGLGPRFSATASRAHAGRFILPRQARPSWRSRMYANAWLGPQPGHDLPGNIRAADQFPASWISTAPPLRQSIGSLRRSTCRTSKVRVPSTPGQPTGVQSPGPPPGGQPVFWALGTPPGFFASSFRPKTRAVMRKASGCRVAGSTEITSGRFEITPATARLATEIPVNRSIPCVRPRMSRAIPTRSGGKWLSPGATRSADRWW